MNGNDVMLCENGESGLTAFQSGSFDLCILDIMMPKKDGFTLISEIRTMNKEVPVIFLTARNMREDMLKGYRNGADDYIIKPFDSELLLLKIRAIIHRSKNGQVQSSQHIFEIGGYNFNARLRSLEGPG